jgi:hypothetical protein
MSIEDLAHRMAWRYRKSSDPSHSDTYTFNRETLLQFAEEILAAERERHTRTPLTDEQLDALAMDKDGLPNSHLEFARAIERAHGIGA